MKKKRKHSITTASQRAALPYRPAPYWQLIGRGLSLGYRPSQVIDEGSWLARWNDRDSGKILQRTLGPFLDIIDNDRNRVTLSAFDQAAQAARAWEEDMKGGISNASPNVFDACDHYLKTALGTRPKARKAAHRMFLYRITDEQLGRKKLADLRNHHLREWMQWCVDQTLEQKGADPSDRDALRRARATANRDFRTLRAGLNRAYFDGFCSSNAAWSKGIAFENTVKGRTNYLTTEQTTAWIRCTPQPLADFLTGLLHTAARPGELALALVRDFDSAAGYIRIETGKRKEDHCRDMRIVPLTTAAISFFEGITTDKNASDLIFRTKTGVMWSRQTWLHCKYFAIAAGLPDETTAYDLRHAAISRWIAGGISPYDVAKIAGTSIAMIETHYGHLLTSITRKKLDQAEVLTRGS